VTGGPRPSYASGASTTPLLGETIGENLRRVVARLPDHEALVSCHQGYRAPIASSGS
jgi:fatty-acyl-CoA synthase